MSNYEVVNELVRMNARKLAKHDTKTLSMIQVLTLLKDTSVMLDAFDVLHDWAKGPNTILVFTGVDKNLYDELTEDEKAVLVSAWINEYLYYMSVFLTERVEGSK